jgi:hypothetical protein
MSTNLVSDSYELPADYLYEIGRIVVGWNKLESLILHTSVIALLGEFSKDGRALAVLTHMAFPQRLDALSSMLRIIDENLAEVYIQQVQGLLRQSQDKRNAALHQEWIAEEDGVKRLNIKARGALKLTLHPVSIQELIDVSQFIDEAHTQLVCLVTIPLSAKMEPQYGQ